MPLERNKRAEDVLINGEKMLAKLLDQIWQAMFIVSIFAGGSSIFRYTTTGWLPIYSLHLLVAIFIWIIFFSRHKLSFSTKTGILLGIFYVIGIAGLYTFGLIGAGIWWLILCALLAKVFYSLRAGLIHAAISLILILAAAFAYTSGLISLRYDLNGYLTSVSTWTTLIFGCVFISLSIFSAITAYQRAIVSLLRDIGRSREKIAVQNQELKKLRGLLPICAQCKNIRDDKGSWNSVENYIESNSTATFTHCLCPDCGKTLYGDVWDRAEKESKEE